MTVEDYKLLVKEGIQEAVTAGRIAEKAQPNDALKMTEDRLRYLPDVKAKMEDCRYEIAEINKYGVRRSTRPVGSFLKSTNRIPPDELKEVLIANLEADILSCEQEIRAVERALEAVKDDPYFRVITGRYIDEIDDEKIAEEICCEPTTVWRNRKRLIRRIAVRLYGPAAL